MAELNVSGLRGQTLDQIRASNPALADQVAALIKTPIAGARAAIPMAPTVPVDRHPEVAKAIAQQRLTDLAGLAKLGAAAATKLGTVGLASALDDSAIAALVADKTLSAQQGAAVGLAVAVQALADYDVPLATTVRDVVVPSLGRPATSTAELASITPAQWTALLAKAPLPAGVTPESAGAGLSARLAQIHPNVALIARLPAFDRNATPQARTALAASYPGLGLADLFTRNDLDGVARRVGLVGSIVKTLGDTFVLGLDLSNGSADLTKLGIDGATADDKAAVTECMRAYQRTYAIASSIDLTQTLVAAGYTSGYAIANSDVDELAAKIGGDATSSRQVWQEARATMAHSSLSASAVMQAIQGNAAMRPWTNYPPPAKSYLAQLPGFQDLFGSLSYCACDECESIYGAAAYFVDLMAFVDENIAPQFKGHPNHQLDLKTRRPDLWTLPLTCANTNDLIATLDIVCEVLENFIAKQKNYPGSYDDRTAVARFVYHDHLLTEINSFAQPFDLPRARATSYVSALGGDLAEIAAAIGSDAVTRAHAKLGISQNEWPLIANAQTQLVTLATYYDIALTGTKLDVPTIAQAMQLSRDDLGAVVATAYVRGAAATISIVAAKRDANSIQNDVEWLENFNPAALDRMHRLTRLSHHVPWSIAELDRVLTAFGGDISEPLLVNISRLRTIQDELTLSVDDAIALIAKLPDDLVAARFNQATFLLADKAWPDDTRHFVDPALRTQTSAPADSALARLQVGLAVDHDGLTALLTRLATPLGINLTAANDDDRFVTLGPDHLALLYRHALLAKKLTLAVPDLFALLGFLGIADATGLDAVEHLLDLRAWMRTTHYKTDDIAIAIGLPPSDPSVYPVASDVATSLVASATPQIAFKDTIFAVQPGLTEQASRDVIAANSTVVEPADPTDPTVFRIRPDVAFDTVAITVPPSAVVPDSTASNGLRLVTADELRAVLRDHLQPDVLIHALAATLGFAVDKTTALLALAGQTPASQDVIRAVEGAGPIAPLVTVVTAILPLATIFKASSWDAVALGFVLAHPGAFGIAAGPFSKIALDALRSLSVWQRLSERALANGQALDPADLQTVLAGFAGTFAQTTDPAMARVLGVPVGLIVGLRNHVVLSANAASSLDRLDAATSLATTLGLDGGAFAASASLDYDTLDGAANAAQAALRAANADPETQSTVLDKAEQPVREAKRDALAAWLLHTSQPKVWSTLEDLYEYFLIDVAAGGCSETSRVVSATNSVQLYIYRVLMQLEVDRLADTDPNHIALQLKEDPAKEWAWRQNFRVWQANRKVFLWPENYLEPDLRDDKTPLFQDLEATLLGAEISDQTVLDAYNAYLAGFTELASLKIAGAYHDDTGDTDVLHLFGVANTDPPTYYYRSATNISAASRSLKKTAVWTSWQKLSLQVSSRRVAPVVFDGKLYVFWNKVQTRPKNEVTNGASKFAGYSHLFSLYYTTYRPDGTWTPAQQVALPSNYNYGPAAGEVFDEVGGTSAKLDPNHRDHTDPIDDYTLSGPNWDGLWPDTTGGKLYLASRDFLECDKLDLYRRTSKEDGPGAPTHKPNLLCAKDDNSLWYGKPIIWTWEAATIANAVIDEARLDQLDLDVPLKVFLTPGLYQGKIGTLPANTDLLAIPGTVQNAIAQSGVDVIYLEESSQAAGKYSALRIGTTLADKLAARLFNDGFDELLSISYQMGLQEQDLPISSNGNAIADRTNAGTLDYTGAYGVYYRELFFHIPFAIANTLNAQGQYASAQRWYHYIFDPMATKPVKVPSGLSAEEAAHRKLDRVWQYREFRGRDLVVMRDILTDPAALDAYRNDPFNPFAIARCRISAFQQAIVMKYVDNLLDWADDLFTQFTMESVNEALMLYVMAQDILGPRPTELGDCGDSAAAKTYQTIGPLIDKASQVLIELETWTIGYQVAKKAQISASYKYAIDDVLLYGATSRVSLAERPTANVSPTVTRSALANVAIGANGATNVAATPVAASSAPRRAMPALQWAKLQTASWGPMRGNAAKTTTNGRVFQPARMQDSYGWIGRYGWSVVRQLAPVFCIPVNSDLLAYWDRVEDRLYKIRHCMNIDGTVEQLSLFAPPIDPRLLVAAAAAGLTIEDVLGATSGSLPPYRFTYLIDRAKSAAASLTGFGAALLGALEKKDGEDLNKLRLVQAKNLTAMSRQIRQLDIDAAQAVVDSTQKQLDSANQRLDYYNDLYQGGRSGWETAQSIATHTSSIISGAAATAFTVAAIAHLVPQAGSPFAMKYGGLEIGSSGHNFGEFGTAGAMAADALSRSSGLEAGFDRRDSTWDHQRKQAKLDVQALEKTLKAAQIRLDQANRAMTIQDTTLDQIEEMIDRNDSKFTNLGLYTWLARQMQILYRAAYQHALALARLAEQAFRFERGDDATVSLAASYWDSTHAGFLAGEGLLGGLQALERRFIETNYRTLEVDQPFALSQLDASALLALRETGTCTFTIPEVMFDLFYPGHYKRRTRAVRITMPCITGPFVNVGATLTLERSWVRTKADGSGDLVEVPPSRTTSIATSTAQADAGVFEISFRDERYMPFEGQGAISQWTLALPSAFRQFDYETITDVIISISYNSEFSGALRDKVESSNAQLVGGILNYYTANSTRRAFSLRQDFSSTFSRLLRSPLGTQLKLEITDAHLPLLFRGRDIQVSKVVALARPATGISAAGLALTIDGTAVTGFAPNPAYAGLAAATVGGPFGPTLRGTHTLAVTGSGAMQPANAGDGALDPAALLDLMLLVEYTLA